MNSTLLPSVIRAKKATHVGNGAKAAEESGGGVMG